MWPVSLPTKRKLKRWLVYIDRDRTMDLPPEQFSAIMKQLTKIQNQIEKISDDVKGIAKNVRAISVMMSGETDDGSHLGPDMVLP
jgi:cell division septal protein FtsQ